MDLLIVDTGEQKSLVLSGADGKECTVDFLSHHGFFVDKITFLPESDMFSIYKQDLNYLMGFVDGILLQAKAISDEIARMDCQLGLIGESINMVKIMLNDNPSIARQLWGIKTTGEPCQE